MAVLLNGKELRDDIISKLAQEISSFEVKPKLAVILVGNDTASSIYVKNKEKYAQRAGIESDVLYFPNDVSEKTLIESIKKLNTDDSVDAILVQLPLPKHINTNNILESISYKKDVDGFTPKNISLLYSGNKPTVYPCTPKGILLLLDKYNIDVNGQHAVVIGRSNIVGRPMAQMLLNKNATVTICHSKTKKLEQITKTADIIISAVGKNIIKGEMLKNNSIVIDVGIFKDENGILRGDVDFDSASKIASFITPVPGGVGPMTIASLMINTVELHKINKSV